MHSQQYIVHEASPTSSGNLEWLTAQWGDMSFSEINHAVASLPKAESDVYFLPFLYGSNAGLEMTSGFYGMQALHTRAHLLQAVYEGVVFCHMTHLNRMLERFTHVHALRVTGVQPIRTYGCKCLRTSAGWRLNCHR